MATRRERLRAELIRAIKDTALAHLRKHGIKGLSLRAVARDLGMSAPGLYRYFDGRDELLTALIADSYNDLADHLHAALDASAPAPGARMSAVCHAYRMWALTHPSEFGLIYGEPIPGYAAPEMGVTVEANVRVGTALLRPVIEAWQAGSLRVPAEFERDLGAGGRKLRDDIADGLGVEIPAALGGFILSLWGWLHGMVSLEVFGQFAWIYPDGANPLFDAALRAQLATCGLTPPDA